MILEVAAKLSDIKIVLQSVKGAHWLWSIPWTTPWSPPLSYRIFELHSGKPPHTVVSLLAFQDLLKFQYSVSECSAGQQVPVATSVYTALTARHAQKLGLRSNCSNAASADF